MQEQLDKKLAKSSYQIRKRRYLLQRLSSAIYEIEHEVAHKDPMVYQRFKKQFGCNPGVLYLDETFDGIVFLLSELVRVWRLIDSS